MAHLRCLNDDCGDSQALLATFPDLASLCEADISDEHIAGLVCRLLLLGLADPEPEDHFEIS
jgi:hypothetical protein